MDQKEICSKKCKESCCRLITPGSEYTNPQKTDELIKKFPFFVLTGVYDVPFLGHSLRIYNCTRWDPQTHLCRDYDTVPRPPICLKIGTEVKPTFKCSLYETLHPEEKHPISIFNLFKRRSA